MDDETRLIRKIQKRGDRAAADILIRGGYYDEIYRYVYRQTGDKETALDLTQEIFISALGTIKLYDGKKAGFRTWLYKIATNKTVDYYRSGAAHMNRILDADGLELTDETSFIRRIEQKDLTDRVTRFVNALPVETQRVFRLKFFGEYTFEQIAELLTIPESSVKSKYYRLMNTLRKEFKNEYD